MGDLSLEQFHPVHSTPLSFPEGGKGTAAAKKNIISLYSALNSDETGLILGLSSGSLIPVIPSELLVSEPLPILSKNARKHNDLSCVRCSKTNPSLFYSSSSTEGSIFLWDLREEGRKPSHKFSTKTTGIGSGTGSSVKPILNFDISSADQVLCAGTELMDEDSFLLFWDNRSTQLLGAYWESHSDDITAIKFHPTNTHSLASGSTDGLMNMYDLLQPNEDDALLYSFNTVSSVDNVYWKTPAQTSVKVKDFAPVSALVSLTHANEVKIWDSASGDPIKEFSRSAIAESMATSTTAKTRDPDSLNIFGCFDTNDGKLGVLVTTLGDSPELLVFSDEKKSFQTKSVFSNPDSTALSFQTAQYLSKTNDWFTCDDKGIIQVWSSSNARLSDDFSNLNMNATKSEPSPAKGKRSKSLRFKPYP